MLRVGLTGGIGSGKSVVSARLAGLGAVVVDSDRIAREVVAPGTDGLREIVAAFGHGVLAGDGSLDRPALGAVVFGDPAARATLEAITHPRVRARSAELVAAAPADAVVVHDVPLLVEVGLAPTYHLVVVVEADRRTRVDRLVRHRGMTAGQAEQRIRAQADDADRRAAADVLLRNDAGLTDLHHAVDALWRDRLLPYERNVRTRQPAPVARDTAAVPDPGWAAQFTRLAARIRHAVGSATRVDHVGPTAVPGLAAPDVLDLQLTLDSPAGADAWAGPLAEAGFPRLSGAGAGEADGGRSHGNADPGRPAQVLLRVAGTTAWRDALLLRDHRRAEPAAGPGRSARDELDRARRWAERTGWRP